MFAIIDDHYLQGPPRVLCEVNRNLAINLVEVGLTLRKEKAQAYVNSNFQPQDVAHWCNGIPQVDISKLMRVEMSIYPVQ